jgi:hypothetical protein
LLSKLLPSPISTRLYDTYQQTVKVSRNRKDNCNGQTRGRRNDAAEVRPQERWCRPETRCRTKDRGTQSRSEKDRQKEKDPHKEDWGGRPEEVGISQNGASDEE